MRVLPYFIFLPLARPLVRNKGEARRVSEPFMLLSFL